MSEEELEIESADEEIGETVTEEEEPVSVASPSFWVANLVLLLFSIAAGFALSEVVFRSTVSYEYLRVRYYRLADIFQSDPEKTKFDPELGFVSKPNLDVRFENPPFDVRVRTNSLGFRDDEESIESSEYLFLGDSFLFGWGVEENEGVVVQFEKIAEATALNMGQSGYGNLQQIRLLERFLPRIRRENQKILALVYDNDPADNRQPMYSAFPTVRMASGEVVLAPPVEEMWIASRESQRSSLLKSISKISVIADFLVNRLFPVEPHFLVDSDPRVASHLEGFGKSVTEEEGFRYCMGRFREIADSQGMEFHVVYLPPIHYYQEEGEIRYPMIDRVLVDLGIPHLDLTPYLEEEDFYPIDGHWKPIGHRKAAEAIYEYLIRTGSIETLAEGDSSTVF